MTSHENELKALKLRIRKLKQELIQAYIQIASLAHQIEKDKTGTAIQTFKEAAKS